MATVTAEALARAWFVHDVASGDHKVLTVAQAHAVWDAMADSPMRLETEEKARTVLDIAEALS